MNLQSSRKSNSLSISTPPIFSQAIKSKLFSSLSTIFSKPSLIRNSSFFKIAVISISLLATLDATTKNANALDFNFAFTDDPNDLSGGNRIAGTVTGVIRGLQDNQTNQQPTSVEILSFPAGLQGDVETNLIASDWELTLNNGFTVNNGNITAADWAALENDNGSGDGSDQIRINLGGQNLLTFDNLSTLVFNANGLAGVPFSPVSAAVPFEFSPTLGLVAMGGIFGLSRLRKRIGNSKEEINDISA